MCIDRPGKEADWGQDFVDILHNPSSFWLLRRSGSSGMTR
jgi:hypothetical protein